MAFIPNPSILDDELFEGTFIEAPKSTRLGRSRSESFDASSIERQMQQTVSLEESIYNHSLRLVKNVNNGPKITPPPYVDPISPNVSFEEKIAESKAIKDNKQVYLQDSLIPVFRLLVLGENNENHIEFIKGLTTCYDLTSCCHYDNTVNYYTKKTEISTQPVILKLCNIPFDILEPENDYLDVYIKTTHIIVLLVQLTKENILNYIQTYLTKIQAISNEIHDTIPVILILVKQTPSNSHSSSTSVLTKKALKTFLQPYPFVTPFEFTSFTNNNSKLIFDKIMQIIAQKLQTPVDQNCTIL